MTDYYATLGVARTATAAEIKQAFRRLASQHHPDKGGDTAKFQAIQAAYAVLGDEQKRAEYNNPRPQMPPSGFGGAGANFNFNDIFEMFGTRFGPEGFHHQQRQQPTAVRINLWITLEDVARGGPKMVSFAHGHGQSTVEITIPAGIDDGDNVRYTGIGPGGVDIIALFRVRPGDRWHRHGVDVTTELVVPLWDLVLGTDIDVLTVGGTSVQVVIPPGTQPGTTMRVRNYGLPRKQTTQYGDMLLRIQTRLPDSIPEDIKQLIRQHRAQ